MGGPRYGPRIIELLEDDTLIGYREIAELLGVKEITVRKWAASAEARAAEQRQIRLPLARPEHAAARRGEPKKQWPTKVIVTWAIDPKAPNGGVRLDFDGNPIRRTRAAS